MESCHKNQSKTYLHPIIDWADLDVWEYIKQVKLPYCNLYDEGFRRLGCVMCPYAGTRGMMRDAERWPKYYENYLRAFDRMLIERERRGKQKDWTTGQEVMDWWIYGNQEKVAEGQMAIYE